VVFKEDQSCIPQMNFVGEIGAVSFNCPQNFSKATMKNKFDKNTWATLIAEKWVFGISCVSDAFMDSFALLRDPSNQVWKLLIQSKLRKGGKGDHNFSQADLDQQLEYIKINCDDDLWMMIYG